MDESNRPSQQIAMRFIDAAKHRLMNDPVIQKAFRKHGIDVSEIVHVPVCFADLDVSARTAHGVIYLNWDLLLNGGRSIDHYLAHELVHFAQQTTGDGPTEGSTDDDYLDNPFEQEGFQVQTEYISETRGDDAAERYVDKVLNHHEVPKKEREERKEELLRLTESIIGLSKASQASKQHSLDLNDPLRKTKEELDAEYDAAIARGPQQNHARPAIKTLRPQRKQFMLENLQKILDELDTVDPNIPRERIDRKRLLRQLNLKGLE